ncbi:MAG: hypothetical protein EBQ96_01400 [Proteobacteria bacterium]|nr:hypothetical protein [Pseudomonadota bacterium]
MKLTQLTLTLALAAGSAAAPISGAEAQSSPKGPAKQWTTDVADQIVATQRALEKAASCGATFSNAVKALAHQGKFSPNTVNCDNLAAIISDFVKEKVAEATTILEASCKGVLTPARRAVLIDDTVAYWSGAANEHAPLSAIFGGSPPLAASKAPKGSKTDCAHAARYLDGAPKLRSDYRKDPFSQSL